MIGATNLIDFLHIIYYLLWMSKWHLGWAVSNMAAIPVIYRIRTIFILDFFNTRYGAVDGFLRGRGAGGVGEICGEGEMGPPRYESPLSYGTGGKPPILSLIQSLPRINRFVLGYLGMRKLTLQANNRLTGCARRMASLAGERWLRRSSNTGKTWSIISPTVPNKLWRPLMDMRKIAVFSAVHKTAMKGGRENGASPVCGEKKIWARISWYGRIRSLIRPGENGPRVGRKKSGRLCLHLSFNHRTPYPYLFLLSTRLPERTGAF